MGDDCTQLKKPCHHTCLVCLDTNLNECVTCAPGFTLVNGYCIECANCCKTCEAANGTAANQCTSCHPGYGLTNNGTCQPCHASCGTCSAAGDINACTGCKEDSTLAISGNDSFCVCDFPKVRVESSFTCENECPTGRDFDTQYKLCVNDSTRGSNSQTEVDVYFKFEQ